MARVSAPRFVRRHMRGVFRRFFQRRQRRRDMFKEAVLNEYSEVLDFINASMESEHP